MEKHQKCFKIHSFHEYASSQTIAHFHKIFCKLVFHPFLFLCCCFQCFDTVGWVSRKAAHKNLVTRCWHGCLSTARCILLAHSLANPMPSQNPNIFCVIKIQIGFTEVVLETGHLMGVFFCSSSAEVTSYLCHFMDVTGVHHT